MDNLLERKEKKVNDLYLPLLKLHYEAVSEEDDEDITDQTGLMRIGVESIEIVELHGEMASVPAFKICLWSGAEDVVRSSEFIARFS